MPSRPIILGIVLFWLATTAYVVQTEVWPRYFSEGPPPLRIDLTDEAAQAAPVSWAVYRSSQRIGTLTTRMEYVNESDTFWFINHYSDLQLDFSTKAMPILIVVPYLETRIQVTRSGGLRQQTMTGRLEAQLGGAKLFEASAEVNATVRDGKLVGRTQLKSPVFHVDESLKPVPVTGGQVLNPMMPVNRLRDVQPGRRWVISEVNPLATAIGAMKSDFANQSKLVQDLVPESNAREYLAEVARESVPLSRPGLGTLDCWLIEYRNDRAKARTWVSVADGRVLQQEAENAGETLRFVRQE